VHPGSGSPLKRWRSGGWSEVLGALAAPGEPVVVTGSADESGLRDTLRAALDRPVIDLVGRTSVAALAAVFERCRLVLGPDSGPLHLAVAVGTPTVHLFGPADPARFGPRGAADRHAVVVSDLPCAPCGQLDWTDPENHPCVRLIAARAVVAAARAVAVGDTLRSDDAPRL
jgi:heptosyltransferase-2/heptosyltransferase-3